MTAPTDLRLTRLTARILTRFVEGNAIEPDGLVRLTHDIHRALRDPEPDVPVLQKPTAAEIRDSVTEDGIRSFLDGRTYRMLKRHLNTHRLTPDEYRRRFGLAADYPLVAPASLARRASLRPAARRA